MSELPYTLDSIEAVGGDVLQLVQEVLSKDAVIAGGWARDVLLGIRPKDVDIWLYLPEVAPDDIISRLQARDPKLEYRSGLKADPGSPSYEWTKYVLKFRKNGVDIDLILFSRPIGVHGFDVLKQFDYGICAASYDGIDFYGLPEFWSDFEQKTITFQEGARNREDLHRSLTDHLERLQTKLPGWEVRNLPEVDLDQQVRQVSGLKPLERGVSFGSYTGGMSNE